MTCMRLREPSSRPSCSCTEDLTLFSADSHASESSMAFFRTSAWKNRATPPSSTARHLPCPLPPHPWPTRRRAGARTSCSMIALRTLASRQCWVVLSRTAMPHTCHTACSMAAALLCLPVCGPELLRHRVPISPHSPPHPISLHPSSQRDHFPLADIACAPRTQTRKSTS